MIERTASDLSKIMVYNAEYAQNNANSKNSAKGPAIKLGKDWALVGGISKLIKDDKYSPYVQSGISREHSGLAIPGSAKRRCTTTSQQGTSQM